MQFLQLGASLYVPATRTDLAALGNRYRYPHLRSVIFCTEDAVGPREVPQALHNLDNALQQFEPVELLRFIRVRNLDVLRSLLQMDAIDRITGFVLPKVTRHNLEDYLALFAVTDPFSVMITLETVEVFDPLEMRALRELLVQERYRQRLLSLRIGGMDLLHLLGLRRPRGQTIYATPLRTTIAQLVTTFRPHGFNLTAPVYEYLDRSRVLAREVDRDLAFGLFGKTAIHPEQVPIIEARYQVSARDLRTAEQILADGAPPVFRLDNAMCEPATHRLWATLIHERARLYGVTTADCSVIDH
jgi:citrate lyase beta subunit